MNFESNNSLFSSRVIIEIRQEYIQLYNTFF